MERILRYVQNNYNRRHALEKVACLPISTETEMQNFEWANEDTYEQVVAYLENIGGFNVKESVNLCFKEAVKDSLTAAFTWFGREEGQCALYNKRIVMAIYDAVCNSRYFKKPSRAEFQICIREALRAAKQRHRMSTREPRQREQRTARRFWDDEPEESEGAAVEAPNDNN